MGITSALWKCSQRALRYDGLEHAIRIWKSKSYFIEFWNRKQNWIWFGVWSPEAAGLFWILDLPLISCVVSGNLFYLSQTQFLYPENGDKNTRPSELWHFIWNIYWNSPDLSLSGEESDKWLSNWGTYSSSETLLCRLRIQRQGLTASCQCEMLKK